MSDDLKNVIKSLKEEIPKGMYSEIVDEATNTTIRVNSSQKPAPGVKWRRLSMSIVRPAPTYQLGDTYIPLHYPSQFVVAFHQS